MADLAEVDKASPYAEGAFLTGLLADWAQTNQGGRKHYLEENPILGKHPSKQRVNTYMSLAALAQYAGYRALPDDFKLPYAVASALVEANVVNHNRKIGLDVNKGAVPVGAALTAALVRQYNREHEGARVEPFVDLTSLSKTPLVGATYHW